MLFLPEELMKPYSTLLPSIFIADSSDAWYDEIN